jgi:uncharacterized protein HemX
MDNPNFLNPNVPTEGAPNPMYQAPQMPRMPQMASRPKVSPLLWVVLVLALAGAGAAWWYINQMVVDPIVEAPKIDQEAREDKLLSQELQGTDVGDVEQEFQDVDKDINSL